MSGLVQSKRTAVVLAPQTTTATRSSGAGAYFPDSSAPKTAAPPPREPCPTARLAPRGWKTTDVIKALANARRLMILDWLKDPRAHFVPQVDGDLVKDGVCALLIAEKLGITQATLSEHMRVLVQAELVVPKRIKHGRSIGVTRPASARSRPICWPTFKAQLSVRAG